MRNIKVNGKKYILIGDKSGAITTASRYRNGHLSLAHLYLSGEVVQFGRVIGSADQMEFLDEIPDIKPTEKAIRKMAKRFLNSIDII